MNEEIQNKIEASIADSISRGLSRQQIEYTIHKWYCENRLAQKVSSYRWRLEVAWKALVLSVVVVVVALSNESTRRLVMQHAGDHTFTVMWWTRYLTLPLARTFPLHKYHESECLIPNPFLQPEPVDCTACVPARTVLDFTSFADDAKLIAHMQENRAAPFIVRDGLPAAAGVGSSSPGAGGISYATLQDLYGEQEDLLKRGTTHVWSNTTIADLDDLFRTKAVLEQPYLHVVWVCRRVPTTRALRKVLPRPRVVPRDTEISLQKYVVIDGPKSATFPLPDTEFTNVFVLQGSGSRYYVLRPKDQCRSLCRRLMVWLQPRELLYFSNRYWNVFSVPVSDSGSATGTAEWMESVAVIGSFL